MKSPMDKITRYLILVFILIIFLALAPIIVLYVSGKGFNTNTFSAGTGILDVQTVPSNAEVYLNGKLTGTTATTIRFIKQGNYDIEVKKAGYRSWHKQLFIEAGKVTYAGRLNDAIYLLPDTQAEQLTEKAVKAAIGINNKIIFISDDNTVSLLDPNQKQIINQAAFPVAISQLSKIQNNNFVLATSDSGKIFLLQTSSLELTELPAQLAGSQNMEMISNDTVMALKANHLLVYNTKTKAAPRTILTNIRAFTIGDNLIYTAKSGKESLQTYFWDGQTLTEQSVLFDDQIADGQVTKLYITNQKELFLLVDRSLFRVNAQPDLINNQVELINFNAYRQELTFKTPTEIYLYNFTSSMAELFYRTSETVTQAFVVPELSYGFVATNKNTLAIETDNRNGKNVYTLFSEAPVASLQLNDDETRLTFLADKKLYSLLLK